MQVEDTRILFTDKAESVIYETTPMEDPTLTERLHEAGAKFTRVIEEPISPHLEHSADLCAAHCDLRGPGALYAQKAHGAGRRRQELHGLRHGQEQRQGLCPIHQGNSLFRRGRRGRAKESLAEVVDYLHNPDKYTQAGASMPKGILLVGPPGTGKTMLAKAVAGEAGVPFFSISGSEFVEMFVGMGASKVRDLFRQAKEKAPCIVFIDEIDAIGQKRSSGGVSGGNDEREQTLNQLLTEMDGFEENTGVMILAATNRPESLDPALTRPGRFDRRVPVELPDLQGREAILKVHAKKIKTAEDVDFHTIARMAAGASGAELANIINEAALRAVRGNRVVVTEADLEESIEVVIADIRKRTPSSPTGKSGWWPTMRSATPWWRRCKPTPRRCRKSPSSPAPPALWATPCRWTPATSTF